ncbi:hypothetical protein PF004_g24770 [Phytophthora fragariae]|uniref:Uncharacterized protein n=1 Tax=Phytophthora fragariae TaxID=53985 RepID=A0A6G0MU28_9STRA|nr:hypothetical protein PF004_g24770 [Phytophthora fragariae]
MATDADGDVEMTVPQPVFEVVQPPSLGAWDQASLVSWVRQRRKYEAKIRNRCAVTGEQYEHIVTSIRNSIEPRILDHLARFVLKKPSSAVNDEDLGLAITRRCSSLQNSHIPDMDQLFQDQLRMDLSIEDTEARILDYFVLFDKIVEDHGLAGILGSGREDEANYAERMKLRCKILMKNIAPEMLKLEMERLAIAKPLITAAGPVKIRRVQCVVIDGEADEFLLGDQTLKSLGINVDQLLEQLAAKVDPEEDADDIAEDDILGVTNPDDIVNCLDDMLKAAMENGFPAECAEQLDKLVRQEVDLWRAKLGADPPAKLEPLRVVLMEDAVPYRTKPRQYSAAKTKFLSEYGKQLEEFKLVFRNNQSRWACAAIPVPKKGWVKSSGAQTTTVR